MKAFCLCSTVNILELSTINQRSSVCLYYKTMEIQETGTTRTGKLWDISAFTKVTMGYVDTEDFICNLWTIRHLGQHFTRISHYEKYLKHQKKGILALFCHSKIDKQFTSQGPRYMILCERILVAVILSKFVLKTPLQATTGR